MARVIVPVSAESVLAMKASVETRKLAPSRPPASSPASPPKKAAAPQAQAAAVSMAPSSDGTR